MKIMKLLNGQLDYNYVLVSTDMRKEEEEQQFRAELEQLEFVKKIEVFCRY